MQITIDTKHDSHEDILKAIQLLHHFTGQNQDGSTTTSGATTVDLSSMFAQPDIAETSLETESVVSSQPQEIVSKEIPDTPPDFSSYLNLGKRQEKKEDEPKIELF